jgi:uncharacterized protein
MNNPFVKVIETSESVYVYDINTNNIVKVSPIIAEILDNWENSIKNPLSLKANYKKAFGFIKDLQSTQGLFLPVRAKKIKPNIIPSDLLTDELDLCSHIILNITESCNFNCQYCIYSGAYPERRIHSEMVMSWDVAKKAIDILVKTSLRTNERVYLGFYGGEPLLRFDFIKRCVKYMKQHLGDNPYLFSITTNGSLLSQDKIDYLIENKFIVTVSLDGPEDVHDKNRRYINGLGTFHRVVKGVKRLWESGGDSYFNNFVNLSAVLTPPYNFKLLHEYFKDYPTSVRFSSLDYRSGLYENYHMHRAGNWKTMLTIMEKHYLSKNRDKPPRLVGLNVPYEILGRELKRIHNRSIDETMGDSYRALGICQPGRIRAFVSCDGRIYVCERVEGNENMLIGTVDSGINRQRIKKIISDFSRLDFDRCKKCWIVRMCHLCFAHIVYRNDYSTEKWQFSCDNYLDHYETAFRLYCEIMEQDGKALDFLTPVSSNYISPLTDYLVEDQSSL